MHPKYVVLILSLLGIIIAIMVGIYGLNIHNTEQNSKRDNNTNTVQDSLKYQFMRLWPKMKPFTTYKLFFHFNNKFQQYIK
jgi:hypothetical protein